MKVYKGVSASPGLVLGQVSRLEHHVEIFSHGPFNPERELRLLANAVHTAQNELEKWQKSFSKPAATAKKGE